MFDNLLPVLCFWLGVLLAYLRFRRKIKELKELCELKTNYIEYLEKKNET